MVPDKHPLYAPQAEHSGKMSENKENWMKMGGNIALVFKKLRIFSAFIAMSEPFSH
jgi:hypothetical protein